MGRQPEPYRIKKRWGWDKLGPRVARPKEYQIRFRTHLLNGKRPNQRLTLRVQRETYELVAKLGLFYEVSHSQMVWHLLHEWLVDEEGYDGSAESVLDCVERIALDARMPVTTLLTRSLDLWARERQM